MDARMKDVQTFPYHLFIVGWIATFPIYIILAIGVGYALSSVLLVSLALLAFGGLALENATTEQTGSLSGFLLIGCVPQIAWVAVGRLLQPINVSVPQEGLAGIAWLLVYSVLFVSAELALAIIVLTSWSSFFLRIAASRPLRWICVISIGANLAFCGAGLLERHFRPDEKSYTSSLQKVPPEPVLQRLGLQRLGDGVFPEISDRASVYWDLKHQLWAIEDNGALVGFVSPAYPSGRKNQSVFELGLSPCGAWIVLSLCSALLSLGVIGYSIFPRRQANCPKKLGRSRAGVLLVCAGISLIGLTPLAVRLILSQY